MERMVGNGAPYDEPRSALRHLGVLVGVDTVRAGKPLTWATYTAGAPVGGCRLILILPHSSHGWPHR